jgi:hypothetical protein
MSCLNLNDLKMKNIASSLWIIGLLVILNLCCKKEGDEKTSPVLTTNEPVEITSNSAVSGGEILSDGGEVVEVRGVCWTTDQHPTTSGFKTTDGTGTEKFQSSLIYLFGKESMVQSF